MGVKVIGLSISLEINPELTLGEDNAKSVVFVTTRYSGRRTLRVLHNPTILRLFH